MCSIGQERHCAEPHSPLIGKKKINKPSVGLRRTSLPFYVRTSSSSPSDSQVFLQRPNLPVHPPFTDINIFIFIYTTVFGNQSLSGPLSLSVSLLFRLASYTSDLCHFNCLIFLLFWSLFRDYYILFTWMVHPPCLLCVIFIFSGSVRPDQRNEHRKPSAVILQRESHPAYVYYLKKKDGKSLYRRPLERRNDRRATCRKQCRTSVCNWWSDWSGLSSVVQWGGCHLRLQQVAIRCQGADGSHNLLPDTLLGLPSGRSGRASPCCLGGSTAV